MWTYAAYNAATPVSPSITTLGPLSAETVTIRRRKTWFSVEAGGIIINSPTYTDPAGTQFGILGSGNFPLTTSRLTLQKYTSPIKPA